MLKSQFINFAKNHHSITQNYSKLNPIPQLENIKKEQQNIFIIIKWGDQFNFNYILQQQTNPKWIIYINLLKYHH